ncbi:MAG: response regulator [Pseudomonadales bacterium]|jgi:serine/threonine-protein kinase|nr:response regulator [Pseudomonadales bacterium]
MSAQARILFVDDEARVLTAMRAMFRRDYHVLIANSGAEALELLREHDVDVIVSDQRMPGMTGVEVLREAREIAPRAIRILLTGYADLAAIEHAINEAEVFRYLMKPCPRDQLREVVELAIDASRTGALAAEKAALAEEAAGAASEARPVHDEAPRAAAESSGSTPPEEVGLLVLSQDHTLASGVRDAVGAQHPVHVAETMDQAVALLRARPIGVVVTDLAVDERAVTALTAELRRQVPELVTIVASDRSDAHLMIELINKSQVFRFLLKPISVGQSRIWLASAVSRHRELLSHPDSVRRLQAQEPATAGSQREGDAPGAHAAPAAATTETGSLGRVLSGIRGLRSRVTS